MTDTKRCGTCGDYQPLSEFARKGPGRLQSKCKACQRAYCKAWYAANAEEHKANVAVDNRRRRAALTKLVRGHLRDTPCADCGRRFSWEAMTFDAPAQESARHLASNTYSEAVVRAAMAKQPVVCASCLALRRARGDRAAAE